MATKKESKKPKKIERLEVRISGSGGQGIISTGMLLGEAIAIGDGKNVTQSQSYGPEARGGATRSDIIISDGEIFFPECKKLDILVAFTNEAYERYAPATKPEGLIIADEQAVQVQVGVAQTIKVPFLKIACEKFDRPIVANIIALGFLSTYTKIVSPKAIKDAVEDKFQQSKAFETNMKALEEGFALGREFLKMS